MIQPQAAAETPAESPAPMRDAIRRIREIGLIATLAWAPLPFGSARPWAWDLLGMLVLALLGLSAAYETMRPSRSGMLKPLLPALIMGGLVMAWIVIQALPWNLFGLHHPLWDRASEVLGRPLAVSLSIDREATRVHLFRLMTYGAFFAVAWQIGRRPEAARHSRSAGIMPKVSSRRWSRASPPGASAPTPPLRSRRILPVPFSRRRNGAAPISLCSRPVSRAGQSVSCSAVSQMRSSTIPPSRS